MSENKQILKYCPNFYKIISFNPVIGDELTEKIKRMYHEYIFRINISNAEEIEEIKALDAAISKYIDDYSFRKEFKKQLLTVKVKNDCKDILKFFVDVIIKIFKGYEEYNTRVIYISRWI